MSMHVDISNYTMEGVFQYLTSLLTQYNTERTNWAQEKEELLRKINQLEKEKAFLEQQLVEQDNLQNKRFEDSSSSYQRSFGSRSHMDRSLSATRRFLMKFNSKTGSEGNIATSLNMDEDESLSRTPSVDASSTKETRHISLDALQNTIHSLTQQSTEPFLQTKVAVSTPQKSESEEQDSDIKMEEVEFHQIQQAQQAQQAQKEKQAQQAQETQQEQKETRDLISPSPIKGPLDSPIEDVSLPPLDSSNSQYFNNNVVIEVKPSFPLENEIQDISTFHRYTYDQTNRFHLAPIQALLHNPLTNVLLSCDRKGTLCFWDSFRDELDISSAPSQVIYSGMDLLTAAWVPSMEAVAVGDSRGVISLYAAKPTHISTLYSPQGFQTIVNETPEESNGLFDTAEKEPLCVMAEHSDAIWSIFNNSKASPNHQRLLFTSSASGGILCYDLNQSQYHGYTVNHNPTTLTSNENYADFLFVGDSSGAVSQVDVETKQVITEFNPQIINPSYYAHSGVTEDSIFSIALHPHHPLIAVGTKYGQVHLFDIRDNHVIASYAAHNDSIAQIDFHPWYPVLLTAGYDDCLKLWSAKNRSFLYQHDNLFRSQFDESAIHFSISAYSGSIAIGGVEGSIQYFV